MSVIPLAIPVGSTPTMMTNRHTDRCIYLFERVSFHNLFELVPRLQWQPTDILTVAHSFLSMCHSSSHSNWSHTYNDDQQTHWQLHIPFWASVILQAIPTGPTPSMTTYRHTDSPTFLFEQVTFFKLFQLVPHLQWWPTDTLTDAHTFLSKCHSTSLSYWFRTYNDDQQTHWQMHIPFWARVIPQAFRIGSIPTMTTNRHTDSCTYLFERVSFHKLFQ